MDEELERKAIGALGDLVHSRRLLAGPACGQCLERAAGILFDRGLISKERYEGYVVPEAVERRSPGGILLLPATLTGVEA